jgi:uncharacterized protein YqeY
MSELRDRLQADLTASLKARDELRTSALRMALSAVSLQATSGRAAHEPTDEEVVALLRREIRRREEAGLAFTDAQRPDRAARERAEGEVLAGYLPAELPDEELAVEVAAAIAELRRSGAPQLSAAMKLLGPRLAGRAGGGRIAAEVRKQLAG